jgi:hypothetical protein
MRVRTSVVLTGKNASYGCVYGNILRVGATGQAAEEGTCGGRRSVSLGFKLWF